MNTSDRENKKSIKRVRKVLIPTTDVNLRVVERKNNNCIKI